MNKDKNTTDSELEAEFIERNENLKKTWNHIVDTIDNGVQKMEVPEQNVSSDSSSSTMSIDSGTSNSGDAGIFSIAGGGVSDYYNEDDTNTLLGSNTRRRPSIIGQQTSRHSWGHNFMDTRMMRSINSDIHAMHSTDAEEFGGVAKKFDETFGGYALM